MADNTTLNSGSGGDVIATDDISGVKHQRVKIQYGADGSATDVSDSNPLPIDDAGGSLTVDNTGLTALAAAINSSKVDVNISSGSIPAGSNTIGVVDLGSTDNAVLDAIDSNTDYGATTGGGTELGALRVTIANDSTGVLSVDDGGSTISIDDGSGSITVDGTVSLSATDNAVLDNIDTNTTDLPNVIGTDGSVGPTKSLSMAGTESGGNLQELRVDADGHLQVDILSGGTSGTQYSVDTAHGGTDTGTMALAVRDDSLSSLTPADGDYVPLRVNSTGALHVTGGGGGTEYTDDTSTHSSGSTVGNAFMAAATPTDGSVDANDIGVVAMSVDRRLHVDAQIAGQDADITIADGGNSITVDGTVSLSAADNSAIDQIATNNTDLPNVIGTDGSAGPAKALSVAGTESGGTLQELRTDSDGHLQVDVLSVSGQATSANQSTIIGHVDGIETLLTTMDADTSSLAGTVSGSELQVDVVASLPAGTNNIGDVDIASALPAGTNNIGDVDIASALPAGSNLIGDVGLGVRTSGGTSFFKSIDLDESEEQIKASAGQLYWITAFNLATSVRFLKIYNATAASVTVGTTVPDLTIPIPTQNASANGAGFVMSIPNGIEFDTAITVAATTGVADADSGAPGANEVIVAVGYA